MYIYQLGRMGKYTEPPKLFIILIIFIFKFYFFYL